MTSDQDHRQGSFFDLLHQKWGRVFAILCLAQFALLVTLLARWSSQKLPPPPAGTPPTFYTATNREPYFAGQSGPWGDLEYIRINLELPDKFVADEQAVGPTRWFFAGATREQLQELFISCGLTEVQYSELRDKGTWATESDGILITPPGDLVLNLSQKSRAALYSVLGANKRNDFQMSPFVYRQGGFDDWFKDSGLSEATLQLVKKVVYRRGAAVCVSDLPELSARVADPAERWRLVKTLSRASSLLMKLRIRPDSDIKALTAYWARGWHVKDIESLLESLTRVPGGVTVDVAHLMPPFARKRMNSYPTPLAPGQRAPDCYWTALNFFNDPPDDRYFDDAIWRKELKEQCQLVEQPTFGDLVFLVRQDGVPVHCAVFVADDVVFTKNGANMRQPWKLMKMEDMLARYPADIPLRVVFFRRDGTTQPTPEVK